MSPPIVVWPMRSISCGGRQRYRSRLVRARVLEAVLGTLPVTVSRQWICEGRTLASASVASDQYSLAEALLASPPEATCPSTQNVLGDASFWLERTFPGGVGSVVADDASGRGVHRGSRGVGVGIQTVRRFASPCQTIDGRGPILCGRRQVPLESALMDRTGDSARKPSRTAIKGPSP